MWKILQKGAAKVSIHRMESLPIELLENPFYSLQKKLPIVQKYTINYKSIRNIQQSVKHLNYFVQRSAFIKERSSG